MSKDVRITRDGKVVQPIGSSPIGGDVHDTFRVTREGKITDGHTTVRIQGDRSVRMPWGK